MWKKPMLQKTELNPAHFDEMTQDEMNQTIGSGTCFIFGAGHGSTSSDTTTCFLAGGTNNGSFNIKCVIIGSYN